MLRRVAKRRPALAALAAMGLVACTVLTAAGDANAAAAFACRVDYTTNDWGSGFGANVTVANLGSSAVNGWAVTYSYAGNQTLQQGWNGTWSQSGKKVTVTGMSWNSSISAGGSVTAGGNFS